MSNIKVITDFRVLMSLAHELGKARLSKDVERIEIAKRKHDEYKHLCLQSDEINIGLTHGDF